MKQFREFTLPDIPAPSIGKYLAHRGSKSEENETLLEHLARTREHFLALCDEGIEPIIEAQIQSAFRGDHELVKELILDLICFHDLGKLNPAFQAIKMHNPVVQNWKDSDSNHSELGWILFQLAFWDRFSAIKNDQDFYHILLLTTVIASHHTYAWGVVPGDKIPGKPTMDRAIDIAEAAGWNLKTKPDVPNFVINFWVEHGERLKSQEHALLFPLYKTIFSALILSDSSATAEAFSGGVQNSWSVSPEDCKRWRDFFSSTPHMRSLETQKSTIQKRSIEEIDELNQLRCKILLETQENLEKGIRGGKRLFYLDAPTGSGKTNCAINLALRTLEMDASIKHAIFVFPFVNLIEQNVKVLQESINAQPLDILEVHSLAEWGNESEDYEKEKDQRLFLNGKISIISSVSFLEALGSSRKSVNYKLCNISNSVIILDEIQSIDDKHWTYVKFLLDAFAKANNCYIIMMSATLPRIHMIDFAKEQCDFVELLPNFESYQKHKCFMNRTKMVPRLEISTIDELRTLSEEVIKKCSSPTKLLVVVNTIKRSREVFQNFSQNPEFETQSGPRRFKVRLLNSQLLPHIKKSVISDAKNYQGDLLIVSTQCIEAGVDADFDVGIRDFAILDSIEQVAGRVNRNGSKPQSELFVVDLHRSEKQDAYAIYGRGRRWRTLKRIEKDIPNILDSRNYTEYYRELMQTINEMNNLPLGRDISGRTETEHARCLRLSKLRLFRIIEDDVQISHFIPVSISASEFSPSELRLLTPAINNGTVEGKKVWEEYERIRKTPGRAGLAKLEAFHTILSKFIVNKRLGKNEIATDPILFLSNWKELYDLDSGFMDSDGVF